MRVTETLEVDLDRASRSKATRCPILTIRGTRRRVNEHIWARRRRTQRTVRVEEDYERGSMLLNFVMVSGVIALIGATAKIFGDRNESKENKQKGNL
jgi:hypothetical protein